MSINIEYEEINIADLLIQNNNKGRGITNEM